MSSSSADLVVPFRDWQPLRRDTNRKIRRPHEFFRGFLPTFEKSGITMTQVPSCFFLVGKYFCVTTICYCVGKLRWSCLVVSRLPVVFLVVKLNNTFFWESKYHGECLATNTNIRVTLQAFCVQNSSWNNGNNCWELHSSGVRKTFTVPLQVKMDPGRKSWLTRLHQGILPLSWHSLSLYEGSVRLLIRGILAKLSFFDITLFCQGLQRYLWKKPD